jgi:hypothetical protein
MGQRVVVTGFMAFTNHGIFLLSDSCGSDAQDVVVLYPKAHDAPKVDFDLDPKASDMLRPFYRPIGLSTNGCAAITGQVFYKKDFPTRNSGGGLQGNGFGPRGAFRLAFVIQAVNEIHPCERPSKE